MTELASFLEVAQKAARRGGQVLLDWADRFSVKEKGTADLVTEADVASQEAIRQVVLGAFPTHGFLGEESSADFTRSDRGYRWIVDPLDGTTNYVHGIPNYSVSIALERAGQLQVGVVYDPVSGELFSAALGCGATVNGRRLAVSGVDQLSQAIVAMSFPPGARRGTREVGEFLEVLEHAQSMRRMGSSALNLCYLAAGRFDGYWSTSTKIWDIAAGALLVTEAGGTMTARDGSLFVLDPPHFVAAATPQLHAELLRALGS